MARVMNKLTAKGVAALSRHGRYGDGGGVYLRVSEGSKRWVFRYTADGRVHETGLGAYPRIGLAAARDAAQEVRNRLKRGGSPLAAKGRATFGECAASLIEAKRSGWRSEVHANQWSDSIAQFCAPIFDKPVADIDTAAVLSILRPLWARIPETASRLRGRIEAVIDSARADGLIEQDRPNPARWNGHLKFKFPDKRVRGHFAAMPYGEVPAFVASLRAKETVANLAFEFLIMTAGRSGEVLGARWSEIELDHRGWTIPGDRMKGGREHRAPLVDRACDILRLMARLRDSDFVFPGLIRGKPLSSTAILRLVPDYTVHGFRSSFRDWAGDTTDFPREVAEGCLAHATGNAVEQAYRRFDALEKRRALMEAWAAFLEGAAAGNVVLMKVSA